MAISPNVAVDGGVRLTAGGYVRSMSVGTPYDDRMSRISSMTFELQRPVQHVAGLLQQSWMDGQPVAGPGGLPTRVALVMDPSIQQDTRVFNIKTAFRSAGTLGNRKWVASRAAEDPGSAGAITLAPTPHGTTLMSVSVPRSFAVLPERLATLVDGIEQGIRLEPNGPAVV